MTIGVKDAVDDALVTTPLDPYIEKFVIDDFMELLRRDAGPLVENVGDVDAWDAKLIFLEELCPGNPVARWLVAGIGKFDDGVVL